MKRDIREGLKPAIEAFLKLDGVDLLRFSIISVAKAIGSEEESIDPSIIKKEIRLISSEITSSGKKLEIWFPSYEVIKRLSKLSKFREHKEGSKIGANKEKELDAIWRLYNQDLGKDIIRGFYTYKYESPSAYVVSSVIDIINVDPDLSVLIDTHTGTCRKRGEFYQKFVSFDKGRDLSMIPMNAVTLPIFGDRNAVKPYPVKFRREVCEIAKKSDWDSGTSIKRVKRCLESSGVKKIPELIF